MHLDSPFRYRCTTVLGACIFWQESDDFFSLGVSCLAPHSCAAGSVGCVVSDFVGRLYVYAWDNWDTRLVPMVCGQASRITHQIIPALPYSAGRIRCTKYDIRSKIENRQSKGILTCVSDLREVVARSNSLNAYAMGLHSHIISGTGLTVEGG